MPESKRLTLIIDGNNLAHYLDHLVPGQALSGKEVFRLAVHLTNYARNAQPPVVIELCFDPLLPDVVIPILPWVRCLVAPAPGNADDLLRERFRYHIHHQQPCVVITNDGEIRDDVQDEGGECLLVYDFVRRAGKSPVFCQPGEFKARRTRRAAPPQRKPVELDWSWLTAPSQDAGRLSPLDEETQPAEVNMPAGETEESSQQTCDAGETAAPTCPQPAQPAYRLAFETWPLESGMQFLLNSFCPKHRKAEDWQLFNSLAAADIRPDDLRDLAKLLRQTCGSEAGFAQQGALMKRVRLALIQAEGNHLTLSELSHATGLNMHGLKGRIRLKAAPWVEIIPP